MNAAPLFGNVEIVYLDLGAMCASFAEPIQRVAESFRAMNEAAGAAAQVFEDWSFNWKAWRERIRREKRARRAFALACRTVRPGARVPIGGRGATKRLREKKIRASGKFPPSTLFPAAEVMFQ